MGNQVAQQSKRYQSSDWRRQPPKKAHYFESLREKFHVISRPGRKRGLFDISRQEELDALIENYFLCWDSVYSSSEALEKAILEVYQLINVEPLIFTH